MRKEGEELQEFRAGKCTIPIHSANNRNVFSPFELQQNISCHVLQVREMTREPKKQHPCARDDYSKRLCLNFCLTVIHFQTSAKLAMFRKSWITISCAVQAV